MVDLRKKLKDKITKLQSGKGTIEENHPARLDNYKNGDYYRVPIDLIHPDPNQPRKYFNEVTLKELSQSIKEKGVIQPIIIRTDEDNKIFLVAGERRFRASKMAGLKEIPAIYSTGNPTEIALIENIQREDLNPIEEAEGLDRIMKEYDYTQEKLSLVVGKPRTTITESLSLNKLTDEIKEECRTSDIPKSHLIEIVKQKTPEKMIFLFNQIKENNLKTRQIREATKKKIDRKVRTPAGIILDKVSHLNKSIKQLDLSTVEDMERSELTVELQELSKAIKEILK